MKNHRVKESEIEAIELKSKKSTKLDKIRKKKPVAKQTL
jgi:hypothetical protein